MVSKINVFAEILSKASAGMAEMTVQQKSARTWFRREAEKITKVSDKGLIKSDPTRHVKQIIPGYMYMFMYDAKTKEELPYWDKFPLIFPFNKYDDGFIGINLHYLPPDYRAKLMDALYGLAFSNQYDESVRLRLSYEILDSAAKYKWFRPCVKRYLYKHVKSPLFNIDWKEWNIALFLPTERFQKHSEFYVWSESLKIVNKHYPTKSKKKK